MSLKIVCSVGDIKVYVEDEEQSYTPEVVATLIRQCGDGVLQIFNGLPDAAVSLTNDDDDE